MSNKYIRHQSVISRNADEGIEEDHWLKQFQNNLQKGAVQSRNETSLFDQINTIMNGKPKYPSVDAAVQEMQERSGLLAYLQKIKLSEDTEITNTKIAADENSVFEKKIKLEDAEPIVIKKYPNIKKTLENIIHSSRGNLSLPAIIDRLRSIHQADVSDGKDWEDQGLVIFVSRMNLNEKQKHSHDNNESNLGVQDQSAMDEIDPANTDVFFGLNPAKI